MDEASGRRSRSTQSTLSNYRLGKTLGIGAFGKVRVAQHTLTGVKVAIKILDRQSLDDSAAVKVLREIKIMRLLSHPHIVRLYEVIETRLAIYVIMEYMNSGELFDYITESGRLEEDEARHFFHQIISGVESCHLHMVVHRDLKPENLLLDSKGNVKIADFGLSNVMRDGHFLKTSCGSPNYAAPEVISGKLYAGPEVDVWSCGVILYALLCGRLPFDDENLSGLYAKIKSGIYTFPHYLSNGARDLIVRILVVDPVERISIPEIHKHAWFQKHIPRYIACSVNTLHSGGMVDFQVLEEMGKLGFDLQEVIDSLNNLLQNQATVTYYLLLQKCMGNYNYDNHKLLRSSPSDCLDRREIYLRPVPPVQGNWVLGFKSCASPRETMQDVLSTLESLNVRWKRMGPYNMRCLWQPTAQSNSIPMANFKLSEIEEANSKNIPIRRTSTKKISPHDAVKFEIQLYKAGAESYVIDWERLSGPPLLFMDLCVGFRALMIA